MPDSYPLEKRSGGLLGLRCSASAYDVAVAGQAMREGRFER